MHEVVNKLVSKWPKIEFLCVCDQFVEAKIGPRKYSINDAKQVYEMEGADDDLCVTAGSQWVEGILKGRIRDDSGALQG